MDILQVWRLEYISGESEFGRAGFISLRMGRSILPLMERPAGDVLVVGPLLVLLALILTRYNTRQTAFSITYIVSQV